MPFRHPRHGSVAQTKQWVRGREFSHMPIWFWQRVGATLPPRLDRALLHDLRLRAVLVRTNVMGLPSELSRIFSAHSARATGPFTGIAAAVAIVAAVCGAQNATWCATQKKVNRRGGLTERVIERFPGTPTACKGSAWGRGGLTAAMPVDPHQPGREF